MDKFLIHGGKRLSGKIKISGAKNSALALIPAALLNSGKNKITNIPEVNDIHTMCKLMQHLGAQIDFTDDVIEVDTSSVNTQMAPYELVKKMRASVYVLGPLLARYGRAKVSLPGGCAWGPRPINLHLESMKKMGAEIELLEGYIVAKTEKLKGARINFDVSTVGATGNVLMAAVLAKGETVISNAAIEPEITHLANFLVKMGARIEGIGTKVLHIEGVDDLKAAELSNIDDRIEAGTLLLSAAMLQSNISIEYNNLEHLTAVISKLEDTGVKFSVNNNLIEIISIPDEPVAMDISTAVYPGFPTDLQAQWTAYMTQCSGEATITDTIYLDRFKHIPELNRLGASIVVKNNSAIVKGSTKLKGAKVMSTDLRASASLVLAGLAAEGTTEVLRIYHLDRGYQRIEEKLRSLGADIQRLKTEEF